MNGSQDIPGSHATHPGIIAMPTETKASPVTTLHIAGEQHAMMDISIVFLILFLIAFCFIPIPSFLIST